MKTDNRKWWQKQEHEYTRLDWYEMRNDVLNYLAEQKKGVANGTY